ncbi:MAG: hypothetical protein RLZZ337_1704 [Bacteroidota bacterium]|jgi:hypothetical protein
MKKVILGLLLLPFAVFWGCKKNVVEPQIDISSKYVVIDSGYKWTYQMDSIVYSGFTNAKPDTFSYKIRNIVTNSFFDNAGQLSYRIEKYYLPSGSSNWIYTRTYSETKSELAYFRNDFDQLQLVVSLPVLKNKTWDGNQYNSSNYIDFYFDDVHKPDSFGIIAYDSTCAIIQDEARNVIRSYYAEEHYAANVGLVHKQVERIDNLNTSSQKGYKYQLTLLEFEK